MADNSWQSQNTGPPGSAVLDMDGAEEMMDTPGSVGNSQLGNDGSKGKGGLFDDMRQRMGDNVSQMMWSAGSQQAKNAWSLYGNIDILRPYFDVEPKEVQMRLLHSLVPMKPDAAAKFQLPKELYGPLMLVFTLIALLLFQMKTADHKVEEGTLIGTAFFMCFTYWIGTSSFVWFMAYVCNISLAIIQSLSMIGYALTGHCIVLFIGAVIHTNHDHMFFYLLWAVVGGLTTARMATIIMAKTEHHRERMMVIGTIAALHLLFLLYLHFAYHTIVEELSNAFNQDLVPVPAVNSFQESLSQIVNQPPNLHVAAVNNSNVEVIVTTKAVESILLGKLHPGSLKA